jgi:hypothetical protein
MPRFGRGRFVTGGTIAGLVGFVRMKPSLIETADGAMEPNDWPLDPQATATRVMQVIDDVDAMDREQRDALLVDLLSAAWPSQLARDS